MFQSSDHMLFRIGDMQGCQFLGQFRVTGNNGIINLPVFCLGVNDSFGVAHGDPAETAGLTQQGKQGVLDDGAAAELTEHIMEVVIYLAQMLHIALVIVEFLQVHNVGQFLLSFRGQVQGGIVGNQSFDLFPDIHDIQQIIFGDAHYQAAFAGIAYWVNQQFHLEGDAVVDKRDPLIVAMKNWIDQEYEDERQTAMTDKELHEMVERLAPGRFGQV